MIHFFQSPDFYHSKAQHKSNLFHSSLLLLVLQTSSPFRSGELSFRPVIPQEVLEPSTATLFTEAHSEIRTTMRKVTSSNFYITANNPNML